MKLLIIRAVHVGLVGAQTRGAPANVENAPELLRPGLELRLARERVAGVDAPQIFDGERLVLGLYGQFHMAVGAPEERAPEPVPAAVRKQDVLVAHEVPALDLVPVAFLALSRQPERLSVTQ